LFLQLSLLSEARCCPPAHLPAAAVMVVVAEVTVFAAITSGAASAAFPATVMAVTLTAPGSRGGFRGYVDRDMWGQWGAYYGPMIPTI